MVGSPTPAMLPGARRLPADVSVTYLGSLGGRPPGEPGRSPLLARSPMSARRCVL
jgi:hypothetical protein